MAMTSFGALVLLLFGGQVGVPLGLPPLPEDAVMASVAPPECLWYFSWSGVGEPDPKSTNQTEQLLAEPEVRDLSRRGQSASDGDSQRGPADAARQTARRRRTKSDPCIADASRSRIHLEGRHRTDRAGYRRRHCRRHRRRNQKVKATLESWNRPCSATAQVRQALAGPAPSDAAAKWHKIPSPPGRRLSNGDFTINI